MNLRKVAVPPARPPKEQRNQKLMQGYHRVMPKIQRDSVVLSLLIAGMMRDAATGEVVPDARVLILPQATIESSGVSLTGFRDGQALYLARYDRSRGRLPHSAVPKLCQNKI